MSDFDFDLSVKFKEASPDGSLVAKVTMSGNVGMFDSSSGELIYERHLPAGLSISAMKYNPLNYWLHFRVAGGTYTLNLENKGLGFQADFSRGIAIWEDSLESMGFGDAIADDSVLPAADDWSRPSADDWHLPPTATWDSPAADDWSRPAADDWASPVADDWSRPATHATNSNALVVRDLSGQEVASLDRRLVRTAGDVRSHIAAKGGVPREVSTLILMPSGATPADSVQVSSLPHGEIWTLLEWLRPGTIMSCKQHVAHESVQTHDSW